MRRKWWALFAAISVLVAMMPLTAMAHGSGSPEECKTGLDIEGSDDLVEYTVPDGYVVEAVCIKSGNNMFAPNKHSEPLGNGTYENGCYVVSGVGTATVTVTRTGSGSLCQGISHIDVIKVEKRDPKGEIEVKKTAKLTYEKKHKWDIDKKANVDKLFIEKDGYGYVKWVVDVDYKGARISNAKVTGEITIKNIGDLDATVSSIHDVLESGEKATVRCPSALPFGVDSGQQVTCTYVAYLDSDGRPSDGKNKVTVKGVFDGTDKAFEESAYDGYTNDGPTSEVNKTINVADYSSKLGYRALGSATAPDGESFTYYKKFTFDKLGKCKEFEIDNKAFIKETNQTAYETVVIKTECRDYNGETDTDDHKTWSYVEIESTWSGPSIVETTFDVGSALAVKDIGDLQYAGTQYHRRSGWRIPW